jgi:uncharacterized membrane protein YesL
VNNFRTVLSLFGRAIAAIWQDLWTVLVVDALWLLSNLLLIPGPPATLALTAYCNGIVAGEPLDHLDYWRYFKQSWGIGWKWGAFNLLVMTFLAGDFYITSRALDFPGRKLMLGVYLGLGIIWLVLQLFALPFLYEQKTMRLRQAWGNSQVLLASNPGFMLILLVGLGLVLLIGIPLFGLTIFFGPVFTSLVANLAVKDRLSHSNKKNEEIIVEEVNDAA